MKNFSLATRIFAFNSCELYGTVGYLDVILTVSRLANDTVGALPFTFKQRLATENPTTTSSA